VSPAWTFRGSLTAGLASARIWHCNWPHGSNTAPSAAPATGRGGIALLDAGAQSLRRPAIGHRQPAGPGGHQRGGAHRHAMHPPRGRPASSFPVDAATQTSRLKDRIKQGSISGLLPCSRFPLTPEREEGFIWKGNPPPSWRPQEMPLIPSDPG